MARDLDEDDVRARPGRGSRPRTRTRPSHSDARSGLLIAIDRGRLTVHLDGDAGGPPVVAMKARELGRRSLAVGDRVALVGDASGAAGTLARIVRVEPRRTVLRRTADDADPIERPIVANADQLLIVAALADPPPRPGLIDRCLVAAYDAGVRPLLCLTKTDLAPAGEAAAIAARYRGLDLEVLTTRREAGAVDARSLERVRDALLGAVSVLVGHSGVGKSTLVNALVPGAARGTGAVNAVTGRGRHTSSSAVALPLEGGGWVIDTPGVRSFGLGSVETGRVLAAFPDLAPGAKDCPRGCAHLPPECALDRWVAAGRSTPERLDSLRLLLEARRSGASVE